MNAIAILKTIVAISFATPVLRFLFHQIQTRNRERIEESELKGEEQISENISRQI
jgi:hypothetical protein